MLPGERDTYVLIGHIAIIIVLAAFAVVSGYGFYQALVVEAAQKGLSPMAHVMSNVWLVVSGPGATFAAFLISLLVNCITIFNHYRSNRREMELRHAFAVGLWTGYRKNFLDRIRNDFDVAGLTPPTFLAVRPAYSFMQGDFDAWKDLKGRFFQELERADIMVRSISGSSVTVGKSKSQAPFREAFELSSGDEVRRQTLILDLPTTLVAFEGAVKDIAEITMKPRPPKKIASYFEAFTDVFFDRFTKWGEYNGCQVVEVRISNADPVRFVAAVKDGLSRVRPLTDTA